MWHTEIDDSAIPASWDWRKKANLTPCQNQGSCGDCWAFAATQMLADRLRIAGQPQTPMLSVEMVKDCSTIAFASTYDQYISNCGLCAVGGMTAEACQFLEQYGTASAQAVPYADETFNGQDLGVCPQASGSSRLYTAKPGSSSRVTLGVNGDAPATAEEQTTLQLDAATIAKNCKNMQANIMLFGPLAINIVAYKDLVSEDFSDANYPGGVYVPNVETGVDGGHAMTIVGWSTSGGIPCWLVRNSWGSDWNGNGYYHHLRGSNSCGIESNAVSVLPSVPGTNPGKQLKGSKPVFINSSSSGGAGLSTAAKVAIGVCVGLAGVALLVILIVLAVKKARASQIPS